MALVRIQELLVVQHVEGEGPALLAQVANEQGLAVRILRPFAGDPLPDALRSDQILAVLGGRWAWPSLAIQTSHR